MSDDSGGGVLHSSEHGTAASHPERATQPFLVAPTAQTDFNTVSLDLIPVACLSLHDILFDFDSSFVNANVSLVLKHLPALREQHKNDRGQYPPVSVFGHADPVGEDEYNKKLSGRRARAIYALLTHNVKMWETLDDEEWSAKGVVPALRRRLQAPATKARHALFDDYMTQLFATPLDKSDFLGQGAGANGEADYQGCADFNPLIVLSQDEMNTLSKAERNRRYRPDRRVVVFLFCAARKVNPKLWPCPAATAGTAACRKRFFAGPPPGDQRRKPGPEHKEFVQTQDTFACRFYDRIARLSPCERPGPPPGPFRFGFSEKLFGAGVSLHLENKDGSQKKIYAMEDGKPAGGLRVFEYRDAAAGAKYQAYLLSGDRKLILFDDADISKIEDPGDPYNSLTHVHQKDEPEIAPKSSQT